MIKKTIKKTLATLCMTISLASAHNSQYCSVAPLFTSFDEGFVADYPQPEAVKYDEQIVIYPAKAIITLDDLNPEATAVAVQGKHIFAVGEMDDIIHSITLKKLSYRIDESFADDYMYPGFIDTHTHATLEALYYPLTYVGSYPRDKSPGYKTNAEVIARLKALVDTPETQHNKGILAWGYDPTTLNPPEVNVALTADRLDEVSATIPVIIINMSGHLAYANHAALKAMGYDDKSEVVGLMKSDGKCNGEIHELKAMTPLFPKLNVTEASLVKGLNDFAARAQAQGVTTVTDLALGLIPASWKALHQATAQADFPVKIDGYVVSDVYSHFGGLKAYQKVAATNTDKLKLNGIKVFYDGSIQGYTALMQWPYYYDSNTNGIQNTSVKDLTALLREAIPNDIQLAIHTNGDQASEEVLAIIEHVFKSFPLGSNTGLRLEHCQTLTQNQIARMAKLGIYANIFTNHVYYWGDFHQKYTLGPVKAQSLDPAKSALTAGIKVALHSDAPVTAVNPLEMIQIAVERKTDLGEVLGAHERLTVKEALVAVTKHAAYLLREEKEKGTIEAGKLADITVLQENILAIPVEHIAHTRVVATLMNGTVHKTPASTKQQGKSTKQSAKEARKKKREAFSRFVNANDYI